MRKLEQLIVMLRDVLNFANTESARINSGQHSEWKRNQPENVICQEISELLSFALKGKVF